MNRIVIALLLFSASSAYARSVAIVPFNEIGRQLDPPIRGSFAKIEGVRLLSAAETMREVEAAKATGLVCNSAQQDDCLIKLATSMKVDVLVTLVGTSTGSGATAEMVVIEPALGRRSGSTMLQLAAEETVDKFDDAAIRLLAPTATMGTLAFDIRPSGAHIRVDNGAAMSAPQIRLKAGTHKVDVGAEGFESQQETVVVRPAMTTTLHVTLVPAPVIAYEPPAPAKTTGAGSGLFVAGAAVTGAGALGLVGGGVAGFILDGILHTPQGNATQREQMLFWEQVSVGAAAVSGGFVLIGGVMLLIADF